MNQKFLFIVTALCLFVPEIIGAQTTVCSGDSVVLALNGYKHGSTLWQQSSDLITWGNASGKSYNDSLIITATNSLYYRAIVTDGTCIPYYSYEALITVRPAPPLAKPASDITLLSFNANWDAVEGATKYYLDVATDNNFTSFVNGFNNLNVNDTISTVTGVTCNKTYYYRVRAYDDSCGKTSGNSNTIMVATPTCPVSCRYKSTCNGNITDSRDNKNYKTVQIGTQCWMAQNLNVGSRIDGIQPQTPGPDIEKYCYGDEPGACEMRGGLYLWNEMMAYGLSQSTAPGPRGICPEGWHVPVDSEWMCLEQTLGVSPTDPQYANSNSLMGDGAKNVGGKLKDVSGLWAAPNAGATNETGFSAIPSGVYLRSTSLEGNCFFNQNSFSLWFTATTHDNEYNWYREVDSNHNGIRRSNKGYGGLHETDFHPGNLATAVRCVKN